MSEATQFIATTALSDLTPVVVGDSPILSRYQDLIEEVRLHCGLEVAALFAEPVMSTSDPSNSTISWYCAFDGRVTPLVDLDLVAQQAVGQRLTKLLSKFSKVIERPPLGALLATWLNLTSERDIVCVDSHPILLNWGLLPKRVATDHDLRARHFQATIGKFAPHIPLPPFTETEVQTYITKARTTAPIPVPDDLVKAPVAPKGRVRMQREHEHAPQGDRSRPRTAIWTAVVAVAFTCLLQIPGLLMFPDSPNDALLRRNNDELQRRLEELEEHGGDEECPPSHDLARPPAIVAPPPDLVPVPGRGRMADYLKAVTVLVLNGDYMGSGVFIGRNTVLTNRHVVGDLPVGGAVSVTGIALGKVVSGKVSALSERAEVGSPDLAVIQLDNGEVNEVVGLANDPSVLQPVWAAGYTGFIVKNDALFQRLLSGDSTAVPAPVLSSGHIESRQDFVDSPNGTPLKVLIHSAEMSHGNSGGPLVDECGSLVGVNTFIGQDEDKVFGSRAAQDVSVVRAFLTAHDVPFEGPKPGCSPREVDVSVPSLGRQDPHSGGGGASNPPNEPDAVDVGTANHLQ